MKTGKFTLIILLLSFVLTGCYTQLQYSQRMNRVVDERPVGTVTEDRAEDPESYSDDYDNRAEEYGDDYIPVYYKDYDALETYASCGCNPYQSYTLSYSPYYLGFGVTAYHAPEIWLPNWFVTFHTGYGYSSLYHRGIALRLLYHNHHYRHWAFHHYHLGHSFYSVWPYHYYSYYDPFFYDPFYYGYYGPYINNNFYYFGARYAGGFAGNVRDDDRRYGPRSDARTDGVRSRDTRNRGRSSINSTTSREDGRYGSRSTTTTVTRTRSRTNDALRQRSDSNAGKSRSTVRSTTTRKRDAATGTRVRSRAGTSRVNADNDAHRSTGVRSRAVESSDNNARSNVNAPVRSRVQDRQVRRNSEVRTGIGLPLPDRSEIQNNIRQQRAKHPDYGKRNRLIQKRGGILNWFKDSRQKQSKPRWNNGRISVPRSSGSRTKVRSGSSSNSRSSVTRSRSRSSSSSKGSRSSGSRNRDRNNDQ